jgi:hypothetical protein
MFFRLDDLFYRNFEFLFDENLQILARVIMIWILTRAFAHGDFSWTCSILWAQKLKIVHVYAKKNYGFVLHKAKIIFTHNYAHAHSVKNDRMSPNFNLYMAFFIFNLRNTRWDFVKLILIPSLHLKNCFTWT